MEIRENFLMLQIKFYFQGKQENNLQLQPVNCSLPVFFSLLLFLPPFPFHTSTELVVNSLANIVEVRKEGNCLVTTAGLRLV